jgi:hypothetical protein
MYGAVLQFKYLEGQVYFKLGALDHRGATERPDDAIGQVPSLPASENIECKSD